MAFRKRFSSYGRRFYSGARKYGSRAREFNRVRRYSKGKNFGVYWNIGMIVGFIVGLFGLLETVLPTSIRQGIVVFALAPIRIGGPMSHVTMFARGLALGMIVRPFVASYLPNLTGATTASAQVTQSYY